MKTTLTYIKARIKIDDQSGCWEWQGCKSGGYGIRFEYIGMENGKQVRKAYLIHRAIWELMNGPIPNGLCILHKCDNPPCCNPDHLFIGTKGDNNDDRDRKGRTVFVRGEQHGKAVLNEDAVREIRRQLESRGEKKRGLITELAKEFSVSPWAIQCVIKRKTWIHVK